MINLNIYRYEVLQRARKLEPGEAVFAMVTRKEGLSMVTGDEAHMVRAATLQAAAHDPEVLAVWTVAWGWPPSFRVYTAPKFSTGETAEFHDRLTGVTDRVVIDEVLSDGPIYGSVRYGVRFENDDRVFVTDDAHLTKVYEVDW